MKLLTLILLVFLLKVCYGFYISTPGDDGAPCITNKTKLIASCNRECELGMVSTDLGTCNSGLKCCLWL
ncbi:hypothetical protein FQR65_LT11421 [Abscondita terminalis]|nr:hypothetical protein FQR65_LT11421 [Abscondita terminalis]